MGRMHRDHAPASRAREMMARRLENPHPLSNVAVMLRQFALACVIGIASSVVSAAGPRAGIDLGAIDPAVRPQDDFWQYANGKWLAATPIPADRSAWDTCSQVRETTQIQLRDAIEGIDPNDPAHPERRKLADL
jgi:putative endopeptidase